MTTTPPAVRRSPRLLVLPAVAALCLGALSACGDDEAKAEAERAGATVGDAVQAHSQESGTDITTAISEEPWSGESDAYVTGTFEELVVNIRTGACARVVFASNESGADYEVEETYDCGEVGDDVG